MSKQNAHPWKKGGSWHCSVCQNPVIFGDPQSGKCPDCAEQDEDCKEWGHAIAAKNGE